MRLLVLLLILGVAFAQCELSTQDANAFETEYLVTGEDAIFSTSVYIAITEECIDQLGLSALKTGALPCADHLTEHLHDPLYTNTGQLPSDQSCRIEYKNNNLILTGTGKILLFVTTEGNRNIIKFPKWEYTPVNVTDTLKIELPRNVQKIEYVPRANSVREENIIYWSQIPSETPEIVYTMNTDFTPFLFAIAVGLAGAIAVFFIIKEITKKTLNKKETEIREQMKQVQYQYMKRQMDPQMFRSIMEKLMKDLSAIQTKKRLKK